MYDFYDNTRDTDLSNNGQGTNFLDLIWRRSYLRSNGINVKLYFKYVKKWSWFNPLSLNRWTFPLNQLIQKLFGWAVTFGTAKRGLGGAVARPGPSSLYQM